MNIAVSMAEKDVESELTLSSGRRRAKNPGVPYPLHHKTEFINFDNWNHMFLKKCCRSLTMYQFISPPSVILDLGCGGGYWALEAAKQWPESTVVGFDMKAIQPNLSGLSGIHNDLVSRVEWVHGNFLDGLPFSSDHFDFVRIANIGLGVPEDRWQTVFEEVSRVMKPGAVLEIIEEDLIFPCATYIRSRSRPPPIAVNLPRSDSLPSSSASIRTSTTTLLSSDPWPSSFEETFLDSTGSNFLPRLHESPPPQTQWPTNTSTLVLSDTEADEESHETHPQDHSRLKAAWERMLAVRFLNSSLINVLPFYLSTCFVDVQSHAPLQVPLPPNSSTPFSAAVRSSSENQNSMSDNPFILAPYSGRKSSDLVEIVAAKREQRVTRGSAAMHLARAVCIVAGCKEAIWDEYKSLYGPELPPVTRTARPREAASQAYKSSAREGFDRAWSNWESDMKDRIGLRRCVETELCWAEPPGDRPDWRIWRDNVDIVGNKIDRAPLRKDEPLCRSLRGFVAWKPR